MHKYYTQAILGISLSVLSTTTYGTQHNIEDLNLNPPKFSSLNKEFPNYFSTLPTTEAQNLLAQSVGSILDRLQIPHIWNNQLCHDQFFTHLCHIIHQDSPDTQVYIAGGMVRSILGYIYQKLYKNHKDTSANSVYQSFNNLFFCSKRKLPFFKVLGVGSDFDILLDFATNTNEESLTHKVKDFINSAETYYNLTKEQFELKKSFVPVGDVKNYHSQLGNKKDSRNAVYQGGSSLDWLAYNCKDKTFREPNDELRIIEEFIKGNLHFLARPEDVSFSDKQVVRGLRALLEIPFLRLTDNSQATLKAEMDQITDSFSHQAEEQRKKMIRNARLEAAHNRFVRSKPFAEDEKIIDVIHQKFPPYKSIPEFVPRKTVATRLEDKGGLKKDGYLEDPKDFVKKKIHHGTSELVNAIYMMRSGFLISSKNQGTAVHGQGLYTANTLSHANFYSGTQGITLDFFIRDYNTLRIVDLTSKKGEELSKKIMATNPKVSGNISEIPEILANDYDIDIIKVSSDIILVENGDILKFNKSLTHLLQTALLDFKTTFIEDNYASLNLNTINRGLLYCSANSPLHKLMMNDHSLNVDLSTISSQFYEKILAHLSTQQPLEYKINFVCDLISKDKETWGTGKGAEVYEKAYTLAQQFFVDFSKTEDQEAITKMISLMLLVHKVCKEETMSSIIKEIFSPETFNALDRTLLLVKYIAKIMDHSSSPLYASQLNQMINKFTLICNEEKGIHKVESITQAIMSLNKLGSNLSFYNIEKLITFLKTIETNKIDPIAQAIVSFNKLGSNLSFDDIERLITSLNTIETNKIDPITQAILAFKALGIDINTYDIKNAIDVLKNVETNKITPIIQAILSFKASGININFSDLEKLITSLDIIETNKITPIIQAILSFKASGIDMDTYNIINAIDVLETIGTNKIDPINQAILSFKTSGIDMNTYDIKRLITSLDTIETNKIDPITQAILSFKASGIDMNTYNIKNVIDVLKTIEINKINPITQTVQLFKKAHVIINNHDDINTVINEFAFADQKEIDFAANVFEEFHKYGIEINSWDLQYLNLSVLKEITPQSLLLITDFIQICKQKDLKIYAFSLPKLISAFKQINSKDNNVKVVDAISKIDPMLSPTSRFDLLIPFLNKLEKMETFPPFISKLSEKTEISPYLFEVIVNALSHQEANLEDIDAFNDALQEFKTWRGDKKMNLDDDSQHLREILSKKIEE